MLEIVNIGGSLVLFDCHAAGYYCAYCDCHAAWFDCHAAGYLRVNEKPAAVFCRFLFSRSSVELWYNLGGFVGWFCWSGSVDNISVVEFIEDVL